MHKLTPFVVSQATCDDKATLWHSTETSMACWKIPMSLFQTLTCKQMSTFRALESILANIWNNAATSEASQPHV